jgi:BirA family transcriptional regulator, biotin operon repressor / biotin---[acetyl-CoA-carboxylase] ligase
MSEIDKVHFIHFDTIDSTNKWAKQNAQHLDQRRMTCVTALEQTAGYGKFDRKWVSPKGKNIHASLFFCIPKKNHYLQNISQIMTFSCAKVLRNFGFDAKIKWPNDLMIEGKKISGVLTETVDLKTVLGVIVGIGLNVDLSEAILKSIDQPAISLAQLSEKTWSMEQILQPILEQFIQDFGILQKEGFASFRKAYESLLFLKGETISYYDGKHLHQGICAGITDLGELKLILPSGEIRLLLSGDVIP